MQMVIFLTNNDFFDTKSLKKPKKCLDFSSSKCTIVRKSKGRQNSKNIDKLLTIFLLGCIIIVNRFIKTERGDTDAKNNT